MLLKLLLKLFAALAGKPTSTPTAPNRPVGLTTADKIMRAVERRIAEASKRDNKPYKLGRGPGERAIVYVEGATFRDDASGNTFYEANDDALDFWNDVRVLLQFVDGKPVITHWWQATSEPGKYYNITRPLSPEGAARITLGYQECWQVGQHRGYEALAQTGGMCSVTRDRNKDGKRDGDRITKDFYGINQHHGHDADAEGSIGPHSAGCLVVPGIADHREFMADLKQDPRYVANRAFVFGTTVIEAAELDQ